MGGTVALFANTLDLVGAAVSFYGGGVTNSRFGLDPLVDLAPRLQAPWLGLYRRPRQGHPGRTGGAAP
jgi:carboxymethylenebutenolidase